MFSFNVKKPQGTDRYRIYEFKDAEWFETITMVKLMDESSIEHLEVIADKWQTKLDGIKKKIDTLKHNETNKHK